MLNRDDNKLAGFVFKGQLAECAIDAIKEVKDTTSESTVDATVRRFAQVGLDAAATGEASKMAPVYVAMAAFENTVREFISSRLLEERGAQWWTTCVSADIRRRAECRQKEEEKIRWHGSRGLSPIHFTDLKDLTAILQNNWAVFEDLLQDQNWTKHIIDTIERSRNVIMHSGQLSMDDIERVAVSIRDWLRQVGS